MHGTADIGEERCGLMMTVMMLNALARVTILHGCCFVYLYSPPSTFPIFTVSCFYLNLLLPSLSSTPFPRPQLASHLRRRTGVTCYRRNARGRREADDEWRYRRSAVCFVVSVVFF